MIVYVTTRCFSAVIDAAGALFHWYVIGRAAPSEPVISVTTSVAVMRSILGPLLTAPRGAPSATDSDRALDTGASSDAVIFWFFSFVATA